MFFARLYRVVPLLAVLGVVACIIYGVSVMRYAPPRAKEIVIKYFLIMFGGLSIFFALASLYALFEGNTNVFDLMACFFGTVLVGLIITLICRAVFLKHNPAFRVKTTKMNRKRNWPWSK